MKWFIVTFAAVVAGLAVGRHAANALAERGVPIAASNTLRTERPWLP